MCHHTETEHLDVGREEGAEHRTSMCEGSCYFEQIFIEMWLTSVAHGSVVGVGVGGGGGGVNCGGGGGVGFFLSHKKKIKTNFIFTALTEENNETRFYVSCAPITYPIL